MSFHFRSPLVYLITDGSLTNENFTAGKHATLRITEAAAEAGVGLVQIREKQLTGRLLYELCEDAVSICRGTETCVLVNGRADVAIAAGAAGVQLPSDGVPVAELRRHVPEGFIIGSSVHAIDEAIAARNDGADFVTFSPIFASPGKGDGVGLEALSECVKAVAGFPVVALGGIDASNYEKALDAGAAGFAAIRFLNDAEQLKRLGRALKRYGSIGTR
ncbi:MAG: thiamine phosphate synthase [Pyrinomonadaceae bacterium]|nr:thiamine phosphate synthase [Pyrinomonadaceae bacterium]